MESLKNFLTPTTFSLYGYIVAIIYPIAGIILSVITGSLRVEERQNFKCNVGSNSSFDKNFLQTSCYGQYDQQYNLHVPLYGFVLLSFFILTLVCIIYSWCCVKSPVKEKEVEQVLMIDAENPRLRRQSVFTCYLTQLLLRLILSILFIILQNFVLYPSGFPTSFTCEMSIMKLSNLSVYDCRNAIGSQKDVCGKIVWIVHLILVFLVGCEVIYLMTRACKNKTFMNDFVFCRNHLYNKRAKQCRHSKELVNIERHAFEETALVNIDQPFYDEITTLEGHKGCKNPDDVCVNLIIGRSTPDFDMETMDRQRIQEEYVKLLPNSITMNRLEKLFLPNEDSSDPHTILVLGCPGIGKTRLCKKLLHELSDGEMVQDEARKFHHLFLFHFGNFNSEETKSISLRTLLSCGEYSGGKLNKEVFQFVLEHPDKILLVFDGLDELVDHKKCMVEEETHSGNGVTEEMPVGALYVKLVKGKILEGASVITTTRPYAIDSVSGFDRTVEILGFSTEKVEEYCRNFFHDKTAVMERVWQCIQSNLYLLHFCYIPVNCFIACSVLEKNIEQTMSTVKDVGLSNRRLTEIYEKALSWLFISKHHTDYENPNDLVLKYKSLFRVEVMLSKLETLALKGMNEKRMIFESEEVQGIENCGLLNRIPDVECDASTFKPQYCFIHLTMQEFLAARGIAKKDLKDRQELISSKREDDKWHLVIEFVAALLEDNVE